MHLHLPSLAIGALIGVAFGYFILRWVTMVKTDAVKLTGDAKSEAAVVDTALKNLAATAVKDVKTDETVVEHTFDGVVADVKADVESKPSIPSTKT
jgi:hypothetical protein